MYRSHILPQLMTQASSFLLHTLHTSLMFPRDKHNLRRMAGNATWIRLLHPPPVLDPSFELSTPYSSRFTHVSARRVTRTISAGYDVLHNQHSYTIPSPRLTISLPNRSHIIPVPRDKSDLRRTVLC